MKKYLNKIIDKAVSMGIFFVLLLMIVFQLKEVSICGVLAIILLSAGLEVLVGEVILILRRKLKNK